MFHTSQRTKQRTPAEVQAPATGAPAEIEGAKGVPEVPTSEKEGPEKEGPVVSAGLGANHQDLTGNNRQQSPSHEQPPTTNNSNHQPTATSHQQPAAATNRQPPASNHQPTGADTQQPPATTSQQLPSTTVSQEPPTTSVQQPTPSELDRAVHCIPSCKVPPTANMVECASCKNRYHYRCVTFKLARGGKPVRGSAKVMQEVREADPGFEYRCTSCSTAKSVHCIQSCKVPPTANMLECASCKNRYHYSCVYLRPPGTAVQQRGSERLVREIRDADPCFSYKCASCEVAKPKAPRPQAAVPKAAKKCGHTYERCRMGSCSHDCCGHFKEDAAVVAAAALESAAIIRKTAPQSPPAGLDHMLLQAQPTTLEAKKCCTPTPMASSPSSHQRRRPRCTTA